MKALSVPHRNEYISLDFDTMYKLIAASCFHFVYSTAVFWLLFPGRQSSVHAFAMMSQFVSEGQRAAENGVLSGLVIATFPFTQKYPLFHYFSIMFKNRIALLYFRWLLESLITYFDIFHSWNIYVNGFQQA